MNNQHDLQNVKTKTDVSVDLRQAQFESQDHQAKTENEIPQRLITEQNDNSPPDQNDNEGTKSKVVNLLNDMDTDNISDNASNYTMFLKGHNNNNNNNNQ